MYMHSNKHDRYCALIIIALTNTVILANMVTLASSPLPH